MPKHIKNIYKTTYDGFIICTHKNDDTIETYEGKALCPDWLQNWLSKNQPIEIHDFHMNAISYGLCD